MKHFFLCRKGLDYLHRTYHCGFSLGFTLKLCKSSPVTVHSKIFSELLLLLMSYDVMYFWLHIEAKC